MADAKTLQLGDKVKDEITGYTGICVAKTEWMNGCWRIIIQSQEMKDGKPIDSYTVDIEQIVILKPKKTPETKARPTGGPRPNAIRASDPTR